ncbi:MAG: hypothetical protein ACJ8GW_09265 [Massilia sp.]
MKTPTLSPLVRLCGAILFASSLAACSGVAHGAPKPVTAIAPAPANATPLKERLASAIGDAACDSAQQCKTMAYGHKACGGPERWVPYSNKGGDAANIVAMGAAYEAEQRNLALKNGGMSTCSVAVDPGATCSAGHCVLQSAGGSAAY